MDGLEEEGESRGTAGSSPCCVSRQGKLAWGSAAAGAKLTSLPDSSGTFASPETCSSCPERRRANLHSVVRFNQNAEAVTAAVQALVAAGAAVRAKVGSDGCEPLHDAPAHSRSIKGLGWPWSPRLGGGHSPNSSQCMSERYW